MAQVGHLASMLLAGVAVFGQPVFRASTELVQVDAVVTDSKGRHIGDLKARDFEIYQDGRPQQVRSCTYVETGRRTAAEGRRLVVLVDDANISAESLAMLHDGLLKLVDTQLEPGDSAAIVVASRGGLFQDFTPDKDRLRAAIRRIPSHLDGRTDIGAVEPIAADPISYKLPWLTAPSRAARERRKAESALWGVANVLSLLASIPGRKGVIIVSDGYPVPGGARSLATIANRASAVVYHIDPRGMLPTAFSAADVDNVFGVRITQEELTGLNGTRGYAIASSQLGAGELPRQTGGFVVQNSNDFSGALGRVLDDLRGYYLLSYRPGQGSVDAGGAYHTVAVKLKTPGLQVRSRQGFYTPRPDDIRVKLTPFFWQAAGQAPGLKSYVHIEAAGLRFGKGDVLHVILTATDSEGHAVERVARTLDIEAGGKRLDAIRKYGFVATVEMPSPKPGVYWLSAAVTERPSLRSGGAGEPLAVPDLSAGAVVVPTIQMMVDDDADGFATVSSAARRRFRRGEPIAWFCQVFHPAQEGVRVSVQVMSGDKPVFESRPVAAEGGRSPAMVHGRLRLGSDLAAGMYSLRVVAGAADQSIDFELVE